VAGVSPAGSASANLAMPATWIAELPMRGQLAIERLGTQPATISAAGGATGGSSNQVRPSVVEYQLHDRLTNIYRKVIYRADPPTDDRISFNNGGWVEKPGGEVVGLTTAIAGEFDTAMPPGGWARENLTEEAAWRTRYDSTRSGTRINMDLSAAVMEDTTLTVGGQEYKVVRIEYRGYTQRFPNSGAVVGNYYGRYQAEVWFSRELGRVIRFEAKTRGGAGGGAFQVNEALELVSLR
jgi:hypothetical protein